MSDVVLGLDAGTGSAKAAIIDDAGELIAEAASDPIETTAPEPGAAEQDADQLWDALGQAGRRATGAASKDHRIVGVAMAAQSGSVVPIGPSGEPARVITWMDARSRDLVASWSRDAKAQIRAISGWSPAAGQGLSTIAWLRSSDPRGTERWASVDDYLAHRLSALWVTNPSNAAGMQLLDVDRLTWSPDLRAIVGVDTAQLAEVRSSGSLVGPLTDDAATALGLPHGVPLMVGGHDQACAALALGVVDPGQLMLSAGTAWVMTAAVDHGDVEALPDSLNLSPHVVPGRWSASQNLGGVGALLEWWRRECGADHAELEADLAEGRLVPADPIFVPALAESDRTAWGRFAPPSPGAARAVLTRAVVEAAAFEVRGALEPLPGSSDLTLLGGAAANRHLAHTLADVTGIEVRVRTAASWPARGAAMLAARGLGWPTVDPSDDGTVVRPDVAAAAAHAERHDVYRRLKGGTRP